MSTLLGTKTVLVYFKSRGSYKNFFTTKITNIIINSSFCLVFSITISITELSAASFDIARITVTTPHPEGWGFYGLSTDGM
jgi:hypothetical protein